MSAIASTLTSRRFLRVLPYLSGLVFFAGVIAFLVAYYGNTGKKYQIAPTGGKAQVAKVQPTVKLDPKAREVAGEFIITAVTRQNLAKGWTLTHPELKGGMTRKEWMTGTIPVQPFPAKAMAGASFNVDESHPREVYLKVLVLAKPNSGVRSQDFYIGLKAVGNGKQKHWLVSYWIPISGGGIVPNVGQ
jgi:hypothetical protein